MTSCPAGPQPRPSFWQRRWPRTSCTLMQALGQAFCSWWAARWVRGLFFSRSFSTFVASSQGASVLKWPVSFFFLLSLFCAHVTQKLWQLSSGRSQCLPPASPSALVQERGPGWHSPIPGGTEHVYKNTGPFLAALQLGFCACSSHARPAHEPWLPPAGLLLCPV